MLRRIKKDVIGRKPTLVIWQTGVNDAMRLVNVDKFRETVVAGIDEMQRAGIDVVLLDMQYFPKAEKVRDFPRFLVAMRQIAEQRRIPIMQRFAIMKHLVTTAQFTPQQLLAADLFHPNDLSYGCLGQHHGRSPAGRGHRRHQGRGQEEVSGRAGQAGRRRGAPSGSLNGARRVALWLANLVPRSPP